MLETNCDVLFGFTCTLLPAFMIRVAVAHLSNDVYVICFPYSSAFEFVAMAQFVIWDCMARSLTKED